MLVQALQEPAGFTPSEARRQWVQQTHYVEVNDHTRYTLIRPRFRAKLNAPRPSHTQKS